MYAYVLMSLMISAAPAAEPEWTLIWQDDFDRAELGPGWRLHEGQAKLVDGRLELFGDTKASVLSTRAFPPDVRFEFDGGVLEGWPVCDLSPALCCNEWWGRSTGYHLAFGSLWGKRNVLLTPRGRGPLDKNPAYRLEAGKTFHVVATKDGAHVTLAVDGHTLLTYDDDDPLGGPGSDRVAITTWSGIYVDNVRVYVKRGQSIDDVPWLVKLPALPLDVVNGRMTAKQPVDASVTAAIDVFNAGDPVRARALFAALPVRAVKAAGLAHCLGHLDDGEHPGACESLVNLYSALADAAPAAEQAGLRACVVAARLRGDEKNGRCRAIGAIRL